MLEIIVFTLFAATLLNLLLKQLKIPTIIGYIATGTIIAYAFDLHEAAFSHELKEIAEFGVVFLMFTIGLEFSIQHLKSMKRDVFFNGGLQVLLSAVLFTLIALFLFSIEMKSAVIIGLALALSSTAVVLKLLNESGDINKPYGRKVLGMLLFQDLAVIPILLMITIFSVHDQPVYTLIMKTAVDAAILLTGLFLTGKYILQPFLYHVSKINSNEIFIGSILLIVIGASYTAHILGFSYSLGAFIAGMLIAETHYKYQVEADLVPFRDLLLGVFFITVGMQLDFSIIREYVALISLLLPALILIKISVIFLLLRAQGEKRTALKSALALFQLGEFALVIFELSFAHGLLEPVVGQVLIVTVVLSMIMTPFVIRNLSRLTDLVISQEDSERDFPAAGDMHLSDHVIVIGYGRLGKSIARVLKREGMPYIVVESNISSVQDARKLDESIIYGNAAQKHILESLNIKEAASVIVAIGNSKKLYLICETVKALTNNSKTIVKVNKYEEKEALAYLNLSHVVVETEGTAQAMVEEARKI